MEKKQAGQQRKAAPQKARRNSVSGTAEIAGFEVKSAGYLETFYTKDEALKQTDILKKRAIKSQEPIKVTVKALKEGQEVHKLEIGEDYYK